MHENCNFNVTNGNITAKYKNVVKVIKNPAIIVDLESGVLLKVGEYESMYGYYDQIIKRYEANGFGFIAEDIALLDYSKDSTKLNVDDICTLINYFGNCIGDKMREILNLDEISLNNKIKELQSLGF